MTELRYTGNRAGTIARQHQQQYYQEKQDTSISSSAAASSTATRVATRVRAREAEAEAAYLRGQYVECCDYFARSFHRGVAPAIQRELAVRIKAGMTADVIRAAIDDTMKAPRPSWAYLEAILRRCDLDGIKTLQDWNAEKLRHQSAGNPALNFEQRTYTEDMFGEDFFIDLDKYGGDQV